jgi:hypothetical protein
MELQACRMGLQSFTKGVYITNLVNMKPKEEEIIMFFVVGFLQDLCSIGLITRRLLLTRSKMDGLDFVLQATCHLLPRDHPC